MTDETIIDLFWKRSEDAIKNTAQKYGNYLMKVAMNILNCYEESDECVNDTYYAAWEQIPPDRPQKLLPYLGRITRCRALNRYDYLKAKKRNSDFVLQLSELEECLTDSGSAESQFEAGELAAAISAFLRMQSTEVRNIFVRRYWFSDSVSEIAKRFCISESKVKSVLFRTRDRLKKYLESEGYHV